MLRKFKARSLGQVFLTSRDIAISEAEHAPEKVVLEIGPGHGILTKELCVRARKVIAVEKDSLLYGELKRGLDFPNLRLINADFLYLTDKELNPSEIDIVISNIPYNISSEVIKWLSIKGKEAVLCLQKEFVEHMLAREGTSNYSKLSVFSALSFSMTEIMRVPKGNFSPNPKIDSEIIYLKPKKAGPTKDQDGIIGALMQHKKKTLRNALIDSRAYFNSTKARMDELAKATGFAEKRVFMLSPTELLELANRIITIQKTNGS